MKSINLLTIDNIYITNKQLLEDNSIKEYLELTDVKEHELETLHRFTQLIKTNSENYHVFENFYLSYSIPQIGKEFDILRFGTNFVLNIELKSERMEDAEILKQLRMNTYYLEFLQKPVYCFTFLTDNDTDCLYYYDKVNDSIVEVNNIQNFISYFETIIDIESTNIDNLFTPSNYLISPFNTTTRFLCGEYFLTNHQESIKKSIIQKITTSSSDKIFSISGSAGTGKTLLTYDIAKELISLGIDVKIIHCAQGNNGIYTLNSNGWDVMTIRNFNTYTPVPSVLIVDESQRINLDQLTNIINNYQCFIIFSHDIKQRLNRTNQTEVVVQEIINNTHQNNNHKLKNKVRHNKLLASFVTKFFDLTKINSDNYLKKDYDDISLYFTTELADANNYIQHLRSLGWEYIYLSNSIRRAEHLDNYVFNANNSSHQVIGQEFDNVIVVINEYFYYTENSKLSYRATSYYSTLETLFQAITRTRKKLTLVIINNESVYESCMKIINR